MATCISYFWGESLGNGRLRCSAARVGTCGSIQNNSRRKVLGGSDESEVVSDRGRDCPPVSAGGRSGDKHRNRRKQWRAYCGCRLGKPLGFWRGVAKCFRGAGSAASHAVSRGVRQLEPGAGEIAAALRARRGV